MRGSRQEESWQFGANLAGQLLSKHLQTLDGFYLLAPVRFFVFHLLVGRRRQLAAAGQFGRRLRRVGAKLAFAGQTNADEEQQQRRCLAAPSELQFCHFDWRRRRRRHLCDSQLPPAAFVAGGLFVYRLLVVVVGAVELNEHFART